MVPIEEMLNVFCKEKRVFDENHARAIGIYNQLSSRFQNVRVESREHGVYGIIHFMGIVNKELEIVEYVPDVEIVKNSPRMMRGPFGYIQDSNYAYYGLKLNILAEMAGVGNARLSIVHSKSGEQHIVTRVRALAQTALDYFSKKMHVDNSIDEKGKQVYMVRNQYALAI